MTKFELLLCSTCTVHQCMHSCMYLCVCVCVCAAAIVSYVVCSSPGPKRLSILITKLKRWIKILELKTKSLQK